MSISCALSTRAARPAMKCTRHRKLQLKHRTPLRWTRSATQHQPCASAVDLLDVAAAASASYGYVAASSASKDDDDDDDDVPNGISIVDSNDDVFTEFCNAQVELVAHAMGRGARCMLYLRQMGEEGSLQLAEVASFPPKSSSQWTDDDADEREFPVVDADESDDIATAAKSLALGKMGSVSGSRLRFENAGVRRQAITLSGLGSVDDGDRFGGREVTAAEAALVKQRVFALPSTNALVVPLSRDNTLVGLLVGEMPEGGGWKRRVSARTQRKRERAKAEGSASGEVEVEVLSGLGEEEKEAADTAAQFGDRRQAALSAAARSIVAAWAMHRRADYATAAAVKSDRRVAGFTYAAREPLTVLRTLGGMLSSHLKPNTPSRDMADAIIQQGDVLASLSEELESALYPQQVIDELSAGMLGGLDAGKIVGGAPSGAIGVIDSDGRVRGLPQRQVKQLPAGGSAELKVESPALQSPSNPREPGTATEKALASGETPSCDMTPIIAGLLASAEVMAKPAGVTMTASFPEPPTQAIVRADRRDVRETLALVIDASLVAAPKGGKVEVVVRANGGAKGGVVVAITVTAGSGTPAEAGPTVDLPAGALASMAMGARAGPGAAMINETQSLKIARSLVEGAGGIFYVLPSLPPTVGRIEMWLPAGPEMDDEGKDAEAGKGVLGVEEQNTHAATGNAADGDAKTATTKEEDDAVDV